MRLYCKLIDRRGKRERKALRRKDPSLEVMVWIQVREDLATMILESDFDRVSLWVWEKEIQEEDVKKRNEKEEFCCSEWVGISISNAPKKRDTHKKNPDADYTYLNLESFQDICASCSCLTKSILISDKGC